MTKKKTSIKKKNKTPSCACMDYGPKLDRILELLEKPEVIKYEYVPPSYYTQPSDTGGGYTCITCGSWVSSYQLHNCSGGTW